MARISVNMYIYIYISRICVTHEDYARESYHTNECVMWHVCTRHVTCMYESCHTHKWGVSHVFKSSVTRMDVSWHTYTCVKSHMDESCDTWMLYKKILGSCNISKQPRTFLITHTYSTKDLCMYIHICLSRISFCIYICIYMFWCGIYVCMYI